MKTKLELLRTQWMSGALLPIGSRIERLVRLKKAIESHEKSLLQALGQDLGRAEVESYVAEIAVVLHEVDCAIKGVKRWAQSKPARTPWFLLGARSSVRWVPKGVVLILSPWNYPVQLSLAPVVAAVAAGNAFVLKPSEHSEHTSRVLLKVVESAFKPSEGICILGDAQVAAALIAETFDHIFFTGGTEIGREVYRAAAKNLTPVTLELGGKNPCVIWGDAPKTLAVKRMIWGKFMNAGQTCLAPDVLYVQDTIYDDVVSQIRKTITSYYGQDPLQSPDYGSVIHQRAFDRLVSLMVDQKILMGGRSDRNKLKIEPTVIAEPSAESRLFSEEIFGPLLPVVPFSTANDLQLHLRKHHKNALTASVFSSDSRKISATQAMIPTGAWCANDVMVHVVNSELPFGGVRSSGIGQYHGRWGFETFSHAQSNVSASRWIDFSVRYPPYGKLSQGFKHFIQWAFK